MNRVVKIILTIAIMSFLLSGFFVSSYKMGFDDGFNAGYKLQEYIDIFCILRNHWGYLIINLISTLSIGILIGYLIRKEQKNEK